MFEIRVIKHVELNFLLNLYSGRIFLIMKLNLDLLTTIPRSLLPDRVTSARFIHGGLNNRNILINEKWLIKQFLISDETTDPVYQRFLREKNTLELFKDNIHAPRLLEYTDDPPNFFIRRKWVQGVPITFTQAQDYVNLLIEGLFFIHCLDTPLAGDFNYFDVIKRYLQEYKRIYTDFVSDPSELEELPSIPPDQLLGSFFSNQLSQIHDNASDKTVARIHGDLVLSNIILTDNDKKIVFIDWEYSTIADPLIDFAYLLTQNDLSPQVQLALIQSYQKKLQRPLNIDLLNLYQGLMNLMSGLWYFIHAFRLKSFPSQYSKQQPPWKYFIQLGLRRFQAIDLVSRNEAIL